MGEVAVVSTFPILSSAKVAQCEVVADAAAQAVSTLALECDDGGNDSITYPVRVS